MERLTKNDYGEYWLEARKEPRAIKKLGILEDIEEELGISLEVLFKALKEGVWTKGGYYDSCYLDAEPQFVKGKYLQIGCAWYSQYDKKDDNYENGFDEEDALCIFSMDWEEIVYFTRLKDYGKTWALTKEELE
jgi:hypothetical protein